MIPHHHPSELTLIDYARGNLSFGHSLVIGAHLESCAACREAADQLSFVADSVAGAFLDDEMPVAMADEALAYALARIERPLPLAAEPAAGLSASETKAVEVPAFLEGIRLPAGLDVSTLGKRHWAAPGVWIAPIGPMKPSDGSRLYLMRVAPGMKMPRHDHNGTERTLVLKGSFSDNTGTYRCGDLAELDEGHEHSPHIGGDETCICLIASDGPLRTRTLIGHLLRPFTHI